MAEPAVGSTSREKAVATTVMIVGKSGSGKSTLGNQLLNAELGPDDDYVQYFTEHGGWAAGSTGITSHTSADGRVRVIDTPGIPDPDKSNTARYFDTIVETIRSVKAVNLLVFMVKEDRTTDKQFSDYRVLLKQFNYIPWNKLMVCRQSAYAYRPNERAKQKKQQEGVAFVKDILEKSGMAMNSILHLDGDSEAAGASLDGIANFARNSTCVPLGDGTSLQTVKERREFVERLLSKKERASALREEIARCETSIESHNRWGNTVSDYVLASGVAMASVVVSGTPVVVAPWVLRTWRKERIQAAKDKAEEELRSEEVDEDLLREAKEELDELNRLCEG